MESFIENVHFFLIFLVFGETDNTNVSFLGAGGRE